MRITFRTFLLSTTREVRPLPLPSILFNILFHYLVAAPGLAAAFPDPQPGGNAGNGEK